MRAGVIHLAPTVAKPTQNKLYYQADSHRLSGRDCKCALCLLVQNSPRLPVSGGVQCGVAVLSWRQ